MTANYLKMIEKKTYPILLLVHERSDSNAGPEVIALVVAVLAIVALRAIQWMALQVKLTALPVPPVM